MVPLQENHKLPEFGVEAFPQNVFQLHQNQRKNVVKEFPFVFTTTCFCGSPNNNREQKKQEAAFVENTDITVKLWQHVFLKIIILIICSFLKSAFKQLTNENIWLCS